MTSEEIVSKIGVIKSTLQESKLKESELKGQRKTLMKQLKDEHDIGSLEEAETIIKDLTKEQESVILSIEKLSQNIETVYHEITED